MKPEWISPDWPVPERIAALVTTRRAGLSTGRYASLNLATHVGDEPAAVAANRRLLAAAADLPAQPMWLRQVHGNTVVAAQRAGVEPEADAAVARDRGRVLAVLTADCLPVLLAARDASVVAVAHAGWRGLAAGVVEAALAAMKVPPSRVDAWLGPAIGPRHYVVGADVLSAFADAPGGAGAFAVAGPGRWHCDLVALARARLAAAGVAEIGGCGLCTYEGADCFYSYRRDGETGRFASLLWIR